MDSLIVRKVIPQTDQLFELQLERGALRFEPWNCLALCMDATESRPYSIASGSADDVLRFLIRCVPQGLVSSWLENHTIAYTQIHREVFFYADETR